MFERPKRRGGPGRPRPAGLSGRKAFYGTFAGVELAALVGGFFLGVPYLDTLAIVLPGLLVLLHGGSKDEEPDRNRKGARQRRRDRPRLHWSGHCGASEFQTPPKTAPANC